MSARTSAPALTLLTILAVTAIGGAGTAARSGVCSTTTAARVPPVPIDDGAIVHLLNRATFGFRPRDLENVRRMGIAVWIDEQLNPARINDAAMDARLDGMPTLRMSTAQLSREFFAPALLERRARQQQAGRESPPPVPAGTAAQPDRERRDAGPAVQKERQVLAELASQKLLRAVYSERQLEEVLVDFWFNHFNVFAGKGQVRAFLTEYERDTIRPHVLGRFRDLLGATAKSPAMLLYLDNWLSADPQSAQNTGARRANNLRRRGLAPVGGTQPSPQRGPQPPQRRGLNENYARELMELHTLGVDGGYTQRDVTEVARAFTGWTLRQPRAGIGFRFDEGLHAKGPKRVLGHDIDHGGQRDGEAVLDLLARHPSTARFIATKLARRFVADEPPASLVTRAAATFADTDGNLRETVKVILTSPEFFSPDARRVKVKTPLEFVVSALRASGATVVDARPTIVALREMGMAPYGCQPPTGYADRADAWVNAGALLSRMNVAIRLVGPRGSGLRVDGTALAGPGGAPDPATAARLIGAPVSEATRHQVERATTADQALALVLGSPDFQAR